MTPDEFETCWVPVPLRWRHVVPGDVIAGKGEQPWLVAEHVVHNVSPANGYPAGMLGIRLTCGTNEYKTPSVDPDEVIEVLTPVPMAQAVALTREQIGMQLIGRRTEEVA